ncbi:hypothetical protein ACA910_011234 [Epithemia clementina (nom. ined.)]
MSETNNVASAAPQANDKNKNSSGSSNMEEQQDALEDQSEEMILASVDHEHGIQEQEHPKDNNNRDNEEEEDLIGDEVQDTVRQVPYDDDEDENAEEEEDNESAHTDDDSMEEEEDNDEAMVRHATATGPFSSFYTCDECGSSPLQGTTLYHSTRIVDYDLCQECYEENHKHLTMANAFIPIGPEEQQKQQQQNRQFLWNNSNNNHNQHDQAHFGLDHDYMRVNALGWENLEFILARSNNGKLQNLDVNLNHRPLFIARQPLVVEEGADLESRLTNCIASCSSLKVVYVTLPSQAFKQQQRQQQVEMDKVHAFLQGIAQSKTITTLSVTLDFLWEPAVNDLCDLIRHNKSVRSLFIRHKPSVLSQEEQPRIRELLGVVACRRLFYLDREVQGIPAVAATKIFEALAECSMIQSFLCGGINDLGEDCLQAAICAMKTRPSLKRIKAVFADTCCTAPLQDLIQAKKHHWMKGWNDPEATIKVDGTF